MTTRGADTDERWSRRRLAAVVLAAVSAVLFAGAAVGFAGLAQQHDAAAQVVQEAQETVLPASDLAYHPAGEPTDDTSLPAELSVDFDALAAENPDLYAWLFVPNTNVSLPVAQRPGDDFFYLDHDRRGNTAVEGTVFSQQANARDFSDPVTVLYGHNLVDEAMFATLHRFEDSAFFDTNDQFFISLPERVLSYQVVAAFEYDDRHLLNSFDFSDTAVRLDFFNSVLSPEDLGAQVRTGVTLDADSRLVVLSTCRSALTEDPVRYLVVGALASEVPAR